MDKQDYQGLADSYEFDPVTEQYVKVGDMNEKRWYPSLVGLPGGDVLAVSGLDGTGPGPPRPERGVRPHDEDVDRAPRPVPLLPDLSGAVPDRHAGKLFYSGSNAGYGPADPGPGARLLEPRQQHVHPVPGLRDPDLLETSGSSFAGPVQDQKVIVVGGGGVGESDRSTARIDVIDLETEEPAFTPGPDLPRPPATRTSCSCPTTPC